jgi:hypothetical protein
VQGHSALLASSIIHNSYARPIAFPRDAFSLSERGCGKLQADPDNLYLELVYEAQLPVSFSLASHRQRSSPHRQPMHTNSSQAHVFGNRQRHLHLGA